MNGRVLALAAVGLAAVVLAGLLAAGATGTAVARGAGVSVPLGWALLWLGSRRGRAAPTSRTPEPVAAREDQLRRAALEAAPLAFVLYADAGRIELANPAARELFFEGRSPEGENFLQLLAAAPPVLREALVAKHDGLFEADAAGGRATYLLARRPLVHDGVSYTLLAVRPLTQELSRRQLDAWKRVIRVLSHELNNSLAPISSLLHSARVVAKGPEPAVRLERVFATLEERLRHLQAFLDGYARLARLPAPRCVEAPWPAFVERLRQLYPEVQIGAAPDAMGWFDAVQLEQAVINLLKNAQEAGAPVALDVREEDGGVTLRVTDHGPGLSPEALENAFIPFYSTKQRGSGLGLAVTREIIEAHRGHISLANREGGGAVATCWLPGRAGADAASRSRLTLSLA